MPEVLAEGPCYNLVKDVVVSSRSPPGSTTGLCVGLGEILPTEPRHPVHRIVQISRGFLSKVRLRYLSRRQALAADPNV